MSDRYPGGLITKTPVTPTGPYQDGTAPGIWTLEQQAYWKAQGLWPIAGNTNPGDTYFKYVTMLLTGNGTNGAQNNTFLDSSTNAFSITRNGNTTQGSFSPYGSNWSNYFDGSNAYLTLASNSAFDLGSNDFTLEAWCFPQSTSNGIVITRAANGSTYPTFELTIYSGTWRFYSSSSSSAYNVQLNSGVAPSLYQWQHIAVTRNGSTYTIWINGTAAASTTSSASLYANSSTVGIGAYPNNTNKYTGYISNLRLVSGTAVYTSSFTPSTTPLTAVSGTQLLTCQSNRFIDNSSNASALTVNGTPSVQRFSPFNPTASYTTATIGGSGYFDGTGDYLASSSISLTGDFTIECWANQTSLAQNGGSINIGDATNSQSLALYINTNGALSVFYNGSNVIETGLANPSAWHHIAVTKSGSTGYAYLDGVRLGTFSASATLSGTIEVGSVLYSGTRYVIKGYTCDARIIDGTALYTGTTLTVPTAPLTAITNTKFLCNFTNAGIPDSAMMNDLETVGNAQVSTSVVKYGTGSLSFDGTGDGLRFATTPQVYFGTGDFTIECWTYINSNQAYAMLIDATGAGGANTGWFVEYSATRGLVFYYGTGSSQGSVSYATTPPTSTWQHIAVCRSSGTVYLYINGVSVASGSVSTIGNATSSSGSVGASLNASDYYFNGYIDDLRITKGYARYPSGTTFTPPTSAFYTY